MGKIVIKSVERPDYKNPEQMIGWFCAVFGFSSNPEEVSIEAEMLEKFADAAFRSKGISSSELKFTKPVARSTVIYHLNRFIEAGLIVKKGRKYYLRATEMEKTMEEIEYDIDREMKRMIDAAKEFDRLMERRMLKPGKGK